MLTRQGQFNIKGTLKQDGGFSVDQGLRAISEDDGRYMVSIKEIAIYKKVEDINKSTQHFLDILRDQQAKHYDKKLFLGGWVNPKNGLVYIDISTAIDTKNEAILFARSRGELAIYDMLTDTEIYV